MDLLFSQSTWIDLLWLAPVAPVLWVLRPGRWALAEPKPSTDLLLALISAGLMMGLAEWRAAETLLNTPFTGGDFTRMCDSLSATRDGEWSRWHLMLSLLPATTLTPLAHATGILGALSWGALASSGVVGAGIYLWARALHGPLAGLLAVLVAGTLQPLVLLIRTVSFYPVTTACFTLCMAGGALCARSRSTQGIVLAVSGAVLALCADLRGLVFALPVLGLAMLIAAVPLSGQPRHAVARVGLVIGLILGGHQLGQQAYPAATRPLEQQVDGALRMVRERMGDRTITPPPATGYVWGRTALSGIPASLQTLSAQTAAVPDMTTQPANRRGLEQDILPWAPLMLVACPVALLGLARHPLRLLALLATLAPSLALLRSVVRTEYHLRYLMAAAPAFAVLAGVGLAVLFTGPARLHGQRPPKFLPTWPLGGVLALILVGSWSLWHPPEPDGAPAMRGTGDVGGAVQTLQTFNDRDDPQLKEDIRAHLTARRILVPNGEGEGCLEALVRDAAPGGPTLNTRPHSGFVDGPSTPRALPRHP